MIDPRTKELRTVAVELIQAFCYRTGLLGNEENINRRYLWTDAFAVINMLALAKINQNNQWSRTAYQLIDHVHEQLGKFKPEDERSGWICGLAESEGKKHPTRLGLRIGKILNERGIADASDERLEWQRDGQYFHYHTRWINALLTAYQDSDNNDYLDNAYELLLASQHFIHEQFGQLRMYWKMSTDLSRPLIKSMGGHDPLEGLIYAYALKSHLADESKIDKCATDFLKISTHLDWKTNDPLGLGGLMLNAARAKQLEKDFQLLPEKISYAHLLNDCKTSLAEFTTFYSLKKPAEQRLSFRECGCTLGFHVLSSTVSEADRKELEQYSNFMDSLEQFWVNKENQKAQSWREHEDINAVTLAASILSKEVPQLYI